MYLNETQEKVPWEWEDLAKILEEKECKHFGWFLPLCVLTRRNSGMERKGGGGGPPPLQRDIILYNWWKVCNPSNRMRMLAFICKSLWRKGRLPAEGRILLTVPQREGRILSTVPHFEGQSIKSFPLFEGQSIKSIPRDESITSFPRDESIKSIPRDESIKSIPRDELIKSFPLTSTG